MNTDRDRAIEQLLRRAAPAPNDRLDACPDAEALAAMADGSLPPSQLHSIEAHLAGCARCQSIAAALVRTETAAATHEDRVSDVAWWRNRRLFNWLAPAAAATAAVALWMVVPGQRTPEPSEARFEQQAAPARAPESPAPVPADARPNRQASQEALPDSPTVAGATPESQAAGAEAAQKSELRERAESTRDANTPPSGRAAAEEAAAGARSDVARNAREAAASPPPIAPERTAALAASAAADAAVGRTAVQEIRSPDPGIRWRIRPNAVERSVDAGVTWSVQQTGSTSEMTAGSAPTSEICWLAGRAGVVLRTVDGGRTWQPAISPATQDLVRITASSALEASVDTADGLRFSTADGGRTWVIR